MAATFDFPREFQDLILACYIRHAEEFSRYGSLLDPAYFQGALPTDAARCVQKFFQERGRYPGWITLKQMLCETVKRRNDDEEAAAEYVDELKGIDTADFDYVISRLRDFAKHRAVLNAVRDVITMIKEGKEPSMELCDTFEKALNVGADLEDDGILLHADYEKVIKEVTDVKYGVKTGFPQLDKIWRRGLGPGWLVVPLAPPKRYKSLFISQMALNMVSPAIGEDVLYYPCEIGQSLAMVRMLQRITELDVDELYTNTAQFMAKTKEKIAEVCAANLLLKGYAAKTVTMRDIEAHAKRVIQRYKLKPKAIMVDYAETILSSSGKDTSEHQSQAQVYVDARAMGSRLGCAVIMPDRCNKETVGQAVPSMKSFQGSFQKAGVVDAAIGLCASDLEYSRQIQRTFVFLNRHGEAFQHFRGKVDASIMSYDIGQEIEYSPEEEEGGGGERRGRRGPSSGGSSRLPDDLEA